MSESPPKRLKIDRLFATEVCRLLARGLTETEAVALLTEDRPMKPARWFNWKHRNKAKFDDIFTRIRGKRIENLLGSLETAANGDVSKGVRMDWRAAHALLGIADQRFKEQKAETQAPQQIQITVAPALADSIFSSLLSQGKPVIDVKPETKAIDNGDK